MPMQPFALLFWQICPDKCRKTEEMVADGEGISVFLSRSAVSSSQPFIALDKLDLCHKMRVVRVQVVGLANEAWRFLVSVLPRTVDILMGRHKHFRPGRLDARS